MAQYNEITVTGQQPNLANNKTSQIYRGTSTVNSEAKGFALYDVELIKQDILNHFNIRKGEKIYNPNFGSIVQDLLYEPFTPNVREQLEEDVKQVLASDPRIVVNEIVIREQETGIQIGIELEYKKYSQVETILYNFDRETGLTSV